jgi:hypothetical protein
MKKILPVIILALVLAGNFYRAQAQVATDFSGSLTNANTFVRPDPFPGDYSRQLSAEDLAPGSNTYNYFVQALVPQASGNYNIAISSADLTTENGDPDGDTFLLLYADNFNPALPMDNVLAANDDQEADLLSHLTDISLTAGKTYYVVVTTFSPGSIGAINFSATGAGSVTLSTLPVTWLGFTAARREKGVALNWSTATEQNTKDYTVQHSADGSHWNNLGTVAAAGFSSVVQQYTYLDRLPMSNTNYYRLLQTDLDGHKHFSKVVAVTLAGPQTLRIYPNPVVNGQLSVKLENGALMEWYNAAGVRLLQKQLSAGVHQLSLQHLPKGLYTIRAGEATQTIIIQ